MADDSGYVRIAREVREAITTGEYPAGARLPTLPQLADRYGVSETTVRKALGLLRSEGLIETRARAGTLVRARPSVRHMPANRYRPTATPSTPFTRTQGVAWSEFRLDKRFERVPAVGKVAELFGVEEGEELLARHFTFWDDNTPTQMSVSYLRWADVGGTPVSDPLNEPWNGGTRAQMASLGVTVVRVTESVTGGMPTPGEVATLQLGEGVPVFRITRCHIADGGRVVEVAHPIVRRADTTVIDYAVDLEPGA